MTRSEAGKLGAIASKEINEKRNRERVERYNENPLLCKECGKPLEYKSRKNKFCSRSCSATFNNKILGRRTRKRGSDLCICCNKVNKNIYAYYCSIRCNKNFNTFVKMCSENASSKTVKKFLILMYGNKCSCCGIEEWNGKPITFELEHINGNSNDNSINNVCLLCPNCHSQTPTYKAKNKGNGRHSRRIRYKEDKSY